MVDDLGARYGATPELLADSPFVLIGTVQEVVDKLGRFAALGARRVYLQVLDLHDLDHVRLLAAEVMPHV